MRDNQTMKHLNPLMAALRAGRVAFGAHLSATHGAGAAALMRDIGAEFIEIDAAALSPTMIASICQLGRAVNVPVVVRVPEPHRACFGPALEGGGWGISVSGVRSVEDAAAVVEGARYAPLGARGTFEPGPHNDYLDDPQDLQLLNRELCIALRLPSDLPVSVVREIAAVEGVDIIEFEAADAEALAGDLQPLIRLVRAQGKAVLAGANTAGEIRVLAAAGAGLIRGPIDTDLLTAVFRDEVRDLRKHAAELSPASADPLRIGTWLMLMHGAGVLPALKQAGLDFVRLDLEHTPVDPPVIRGLVQEAQRLGIEICLRPASSRRTDLEVALATGARRLYVPQVATADQARALAADCRDILAQAGSGDTAHISVMLESRAAFDAADDLAPLPGIDLLAVGPADLAQDLGIYDNEDREEILDGFRFRLRDMAVKHKKQWEMGIWQQDQARRWLDERCRNLTFITDTSALRLGLLPFVKAVRNVRGEG